MKNQFSALAKLVAVAACALTLGSCNRAEYAMLPKGASYHGVTRVSTPVPAAPAASASKTAAPETPAPVAAEPVAAAPATVASTTPAPAKAQPKVAAAKPAEAAKTSSAAVATTTTAPAPKLNPLQRLALNKVTRKLDKAMHKAAARQHDNTASVARGGIDGNLRIGIILLLVGLLLGLINGLIGTIVAIIGLIFIVLWLLDQL